MYLNPVFMYRVQKNDVTHNICNVYMTLVHTRIINIPYTHIYNFLILLFLVSFIFK